MGSKVLLLPQIPKVGCPTKTGGVLLRTLPIWHQNGAQGAERDGITGALACQTGTGCAFLSPPINPSVARAPGKRGAPCARQVVGGKIACPDRFRRTCKFFLGVRRTLSLGKEKKNNFLGGRDKSLVEIAQPIPSTISLVW